VCVSAYLSAYKIYIVGLYLFICGNMNIGKNEIVIKLKLDNNKANALKTIQTLRSIEGFKGMSFHYRE